jgi:ribosome-associated translation inhibitor RaiA
MKLVIRNINLTAKQSFDQIIENRILGLAGKWELHTVNVHLERRENGSPAFRVVVDMAVPGPDLHAEVFDHTPVQAFTRAMDEIESKLQDRLAKRAYSARNRGLRTAGMRLAGIRGF